MYLDFVFSCKESRADDITEKSNEYNESPKVSTQPKRMGTTSSKNTQYKPLRPEETKADCIWPTGP